VAASVLQTDDDDDDVPQIPNSKPTKSKVKEKGQVEKKKTSSCTKGGKGRRTVLVGDGIGLRRREVLRYLTLQVLLLLLDRHELFSQQDDRVARRLLGVSPAGKVAHE
jgi:hypothetical protein